MNKWLTTLEEAVRWCLTIRVGGGSGWVLVGVLVWATTLGVGCECKVGDWQCRDNMLQFCTCGAQGGEITGCRHPARWESGSFLCPEDGLCLEDPLQGGRAVCVEEDLGNCDVEDQGQCISEQQYLYCATYGGRLSSGDEGWRRGIWTTRTCDIGFFCWTDPHGNPGCHCSEVNEDGSCVLPHGVVPPPIPSGMSQGMEQEWGHGEFKVSEP